MTAHLSVDKGPLRGLLFNFEEGDEWIIGRDPDESDFVIEDSTVSRKHVRVTKTADGIFVHNLSRVNPISINSREAHEKTRLHEGDQVQIGQHAFVFSNKKETAKKKKPKKHESKTEYDNIFGDLEEPPPPSQGESFKEKRKDLETSLEETIQAEREETPYDTIFEDLESENELPFNLLSPTSLLLKVISGPNAGAEIGIEKGKVYTIGKDPNTCEIVFQDLSVSRNHARLSVSAEGVMELEDLGSKNGTAINSELIHEKKEITPQDLISLGTTAFLIIDREAPQETIYSSIIPSHETTRGASAAELFEEEEKLLLTKLPWKERPLPSKHLVMAGAFVLSVLVVFLSFFSLFKSEPIEVAKKEPVDLIQEALAKFSDVHFSFNPASEKLFLTGHVLTSVEYQEMLYRMGEIPFIQDTENTVVIDELVWRTTNELLANNSDWRSVSVSTSIPGKFFVSGYVDTNAMALALSDFLTVNFPYLDRLQNTVTVEENLQVELQGMLVQQGFGSVAFQLSGGDLILSGSYSNKMKSEYERLLKELNALHGISKVKNFAIATSPSAAGIDISQNFQVSGSATHDGNGYNVVLNGKIYGVGDDVSGMQITSIEQKTILLEKDGLKYKISYR